MGFEKIIEFLLSLIDKIVPIYIIFPYEEAVLYWCGKYSKTVKQGIHFKFPFLHSYDKHTVVTTTLTIPTQSLTTKDGLQVVVKSMVKYKIDDIKPFILEIYDSTDAISDITQCIIKEQITERNWSQCSDNELDNIITKKLRVEVKKLGIVIEKVTMTDIGLIRSIRLFNEQLQNT